ncbi:winged helix-turn-helix domain-containing protein [Chromobacterium sp. ASV23]|uniref:winged helix-turn-helix domain-containing protein n=1 Tax=Chromobacterium sp. ASV23 TaxID=2795110 RepID=UPI0018ECD8F6|nr:winged helix-turn-helix domain-containing protein [Chromobacterium sp. ASV23]
MKIEAFERARARDLTVTADQRMVMGLFFDAGRHPITMTASQVATALGRSRQAVRFSLKRLEAAGVLFRDREVGSREDRFTPTEKAKDILFGFRGRESIRENPMTEEILRILET